MAWNVAAGWRGALTMSTALALSGALSGCGSTGTEGASPTTAAPTGTSAYEPVTIENCGRTSTFEEPPQRAVAMVTNAIELVLALGVEEQLVGTANANNPVADEYADAYDTVPVLTDSYPSGEALLGVDADFVIGALESFSFDAAEGRGRDDLERRGIATYALQCEDEQLTPELLYQRIDEVARIFGVPEAGEALVAQVRDELTSAEQSLAAVTPVDVLVYQGGESAPEVLGGFGFGNVVLELAGARNIFDDLETVTGEASWEAVAERDPEAIIIQDFGGDVTEMQTFLKGFPAIAGTRAVQDGRFVVVRAGDMVFSVRAAEGVQQLARFLHPEEF